MQPRSCTYISQRLELRYWVYGDEAKPPLLLLHGTRDHARSWDATAAALVDRYCVYAPDLRGHGDSAWATGGNYSIIDYTLDIHALTEHLDRSPYTVIGHSLGGGIALQYAGTFPDHVSGLVSIEGMAGLGWITNRPRPAHIRMREWIAQMRKLEARDPRTYTGIESATRRMLEANSHLTPELARHLTEHGVREAPNGELMWKFDNFTHAGSPYEFNTGDARDLWNQIRCPILIIYGEDGWGKRDDFELDLSPFHDVRAEKVVDAGHWVHHDQFDTFIRLVQDFLS
jgi:pimeloyl-ACP methyl ester carboxylesterase